MFKSIEQSTTLKRLKTEKLPLSRLMQALNAIMEDHDQHVAMLNEKGPYGGIYLDEGTNLSDL